MVSQAFEGWKGFDDEGLAAVVAPLVGKRPYTLGSDHGSSSQGSGDRFGWWRRKTADAVDRRPGQTGRTVRWHISPDRLRPVQPRQRWHAADRRPDPVQVALARPAHLVDLADVDHAGQLRDAGAGTAATRPALVPRQRRRDLSVVETRGGRG